MSRRSRMEKSVPIALRCLAFVPAAILLSLSAGCTAQNNPEQAVLRLGDGMTAFFKGNRGAPAETITIDTTAPLSIDIETFNGDVTVRGNPNAKRATVVVRRESTHGLMRNHERRDSLDHVVASAELVPGDLGPALRVRTSTTDPEPHFQRAHIWVELPAIDDVRIRTATGRIDVRFAEGRADLETGRGSILFATPAPITQSATLVTNDGSVDFRAGRGSSGDFDMESVGGRIMQRATGGRWIATDPANRHNRVRARLNDGANPIILRSVDGNVRVAITDEPMAFGMRVIDP